MRWALARNAAFRLPGRQQSVPAKLPRITRPWMSTAAVAGLEMHQPLQLLHRLQARRVMKQFPSHLQWASSEAERVSQPEVLLPMLTTLVSLRP